MHEVADFEHVVAVDLVAVHAVGGGHLVQGVPHDEGLLGGRTHPVEVVLAEEDDGEVPDGGQVHGLVELALVDGAVAKEAQDDLIIAAILDGEGDAGGDAQLAADDGVAAHEIQFVAEQVHGAALAIAAPGGLAHQLGHDLLATYATGQRLTVIAVVGDDVIVLAEGVLIAPTAMASSPLYTWRKPLMLPRVYCRSDSRSNSRMSFICR